MSKKQTNKNPMVQSFEPLTATQQSLESIYNDDYNLIITGSAGTGKSFYLIYLALKDILENEKHEKLIIIRSSTPTKDIGFLPGSLKEKNAVYEEPYIDIVNTICGRSDAYEKMKKSGIIEFHSTSYLRGVTFDDSIILIDEAQNSTFGELDTIITRVGEASRLAIIGDDAQNDLIYSKQKLESGFSDIKQILLNMSNSKVSHIHFSDEDIVRSAFVKDYIMTKRKPMHELDKW